MHLTRQQYFSEHVLPPRTNILSSLKFDPQDFLTLPQIHTTGSNTESKLLTKKGILRNTYQ